MIPDKGRAIAVIPCKSNFSGLSNIVSTLLLDTALKRVVIVAHGTKAFTKISEMYGNRDKVTILYALEEEGIHHMWNAGLESALYSDVHVFFINDDVMSSPYCLTDLCDQLDAHPEIGLICPNYDKRVSPLQFEHVATTAGGRYDGTGGMAGFYMGLHKDFVQLFRFDQRMMWWYGDDDILAWVLSQGRSAVIATSVSCWGNESKTTAEDPPENFYKLVENDRLIYEAKWRKTGI